jgi:hypothetical protein
MAQCNYREHFDGNIQCEPFAEIARLGENCENATCEDGTSCFRKEGQKDKFCKRLINPGYNGCAEPYASCLQGNVCINNRCEKGVDRGGVVGVKEGKRRGFWDRCFSEEEDMFYTIAPMLVIGFLIFILGVMYGLLFMR